MRKILLVLGLFTLALAGVTLYADSEDAFLKARFLIREADATEKVGDLEMALKKYADALETLESIRQTDPAWEPKVIENQIQYCTERLARGGEKPNSANPPSTETQEQSEKSAPLTVPELPMPPTQPSSAPSKAQAPSVEQDALTNPAPPVEVQKSIEPVTTEQKTVSTIPSTPPEPPQPEENANSKEVSALLGKLAEVQQQLETLEKEKKTLAENSISLDQMEAVKADLIKTQAQLETLQQENEKLRQAQLATKANTAETDARLQMLLKENHELKSNGITGSENVNALLNKLTEAQKQLEALEKEKKSLMETSVSLEARLKETMDDLRTANAWTDDRVWKDERVQALIQEKNALQQKLGKTESGISSLSNSDQMKAVKAELAKAQAQLESLQKENEVLRSANEISKGNGAEIDERLQVLLKENNALKEKLIKVENGLAETPSNATEIENLKLELAQSQVQLEDLQKENAHLKASGLTPAAGPDMGDGRFDVLLDENKDLKGKLSKVVIGIEGIRSSLDELKAFKAELERSQVRVKALQNGNASQDTASLDSQQIQALLGENNALKAKLVKLVAGIAGISSNLNALGSNKATLDRTQAQLEILQKQNAFKDVPPDQLHTVLNENSDLKQKLNAVVAGINGIRTNLDEINTFKAELSKARTQLEALQKENDSLKTANTSPKDALEANDEQLQSLLNENNGLKEKLLKVEAKIEGVRSSLEETNALKAELAKTRAQLDSFQKENEALKVANKVVPKATGESNNAQLQALLDENANLHEKLGNVESRIAGLQTNFNEMNAVKAELAKNNAQIQSIQKNEAAPSMDAPKAVESSVGSGDDRLQKLLNENNILKDQLYKVISGIEGIRTNLEKTAAPAPAPNPPPVPRVEVLPPNIVQASAIPVRNIGEIVLFNLRGNFVVVDFRDGNIPPPRTDLDVYRDGNVVGKIRIIEPAKPPLVPAEVLSGKLRRGDIAR